MGRESETGLFPFPFLYQKVYNVNGKAPTKIKQKVTSTGNLDTEVVLIFFFFWSRPHANMASEASMVLFWLRVLAIE